MGEWPRPAAALHHSTRRQQVIYVEHHTGPEQTDIGRIDWQPGWYASCDDCGWMAGPNMTEAEAHAAADAHDLAMGEVTLQQLGCGQSRERPADPGELCTCGRQAVVVYLGSAFGPTGYCGLADGGDQTGPCPFCGGPRHREPYGRCPDYRLRLDER
jgi:hypothetical protein